MSMQIFYFRNEPPLSQTANCLGPVYTAENTLPNVGSFTSKVNWLSIISANFAQWFSNVIGMVDITPDE